MSRLKRVIPGRDTRADATADKFMCTKSKKVIICFLMRDSLRMARLLILCLVPAISAVLPSNTSAQTYYVDPANGNLNNDGTYDKPWSTLQAVFDNRLIETYTNTGQIKNLGAPVKSGDTILLRNGYHGRIDYTGGYNTEYITIAAQTGHTPKLRNIELESVSKWKFIGLNISPEYNQESKVGDRLFSVQNHNTYGNSSHIWIEDCNIFSASDISSWSTEDLWYSLSGGIRMDSVGYTTIKNNHIWNVGYGITTGWYPLIEGNLIEYFSHDGIRPGGGNIRYNTIKNVIRLPTPIGQSSRHCDAIQLLTGYFHDMEISGNLILDYDNPAWGWAGTVQGIGAFNEGGDYHNITIENNVILTSHNIGIKFDDPNGVKVLNNIVMNLHDSNDSDPPTITFVNNGFGYPENCIIRNNMAHSWSGGGGIEQDHNLDLDNYNWDDLFVQWQNSQSLNLRHKQGSPAIDAGSSLSAPAVDIERAARPQGAGFDLGAYEYAAGQSSNSAPVMQSIGNQSGLENTLLTFQVTATDADGDTITYSAQGLPSGAAFSGQTFSWTPSQDQVGTHQATFYASDGQAQDFETITITISAADKGFDDPIAETYTLNITAVNGTVTKTPSSTNYNDGETVTLQAVPDLGYLFISWAGDLSGGSNPTSITMNADKSVTASFAAEQPDQTAPSVTNCSPAADAVQVLRDNLVLLHVVDAGERIDNSSVTIKLNNNTIYTGDTDHYASQYGSCRRTGTTADYVFVYQPNELFDFDQAITIKVDATDLVGNVMTQHVYSFSTVMREFSENRHVSSDLLNLSSGKAQTVCDRRGNIWVTWHAGPTGDRDVYVSMLVAGENYFGSSIKLTNSSADQCNAVVALDAEDKLYVAWQDNRHGNWDIYISTSTDGINWSTETKVSDSNDHQTNPAIAVDGLSPSSVYVAWEDNRHGNQDIYIASSTNGFLTKTVSRITSDSSDQSAPVIAADTDNTIYVLWTDNRGGSQDVYAAASNNGPWTNVPIVSEAGNQSSPAIATEAAGSVLHFLWVDDTAGNSDIYYASSSGLPATSLSGSSIIDDSSGADQVAPAIITTGSTGNGLRVFTCWQDKRNADTDLYFVEIGSSSQTNIFVGDNGTNANQAEPAMATDMYGHPYLVWTDGRNITGDIYYAGSTFTASDLLASEVVSASSGAIVGTDPAAISGAGDVSVTVPAGAYACDVKITISEVQNPQKLTVEHLSTLYEFGPSGIDFTEPVTITIPYEVHSSDNLVSVYWYNPLTCALSQQGITDVENVVISPTLCALRFKTTHFTQFFVGGIAAAASSGGGGGCSVSGNPQGNILEFALPYIGLALVIAVLKRRDARRRRIRAIKENIC
ncbi:MAG: hypothetical protein JXB29_11860 [Sedimentisphaerales bacterium]|nr:hypothetical protein [Sedimentisphaerales bacterium]